MAVAYVVMGLVLIHLVSKDRGRDGELFRIGALCIVVWPIVFPIAFTLALLERRTRKAKRRG